jgi:hypothetical protein
MGVSFASFLAASGALNKKNNSVRHSTIVSTDADEIFQPSDQTIKIIDNR